MSKHKNVVVTITVGEHSKGKHKDGSPRVSRLSMGFEPGISGVDPKDWKRVLRCMNTIGEVLGSLVEKGPRP